MRLSLVYKPLNQADEYYVRDLYDVPTETAQEIVEDFEASTGGEANGDAGEEEGVSVNAYQYENEEGEPAVAAIDFRPVVAVHT